MSVSKTILALGLMCTALSTNAAVIEIDNYQSINGLDWLDLSETNGMSYAEATSTFTGWTLATESQYQSMFAEFETVGDDRISSVSSLDIENNAYYGFEKIRASYLIDTSFGFGDIFGYTRVADEYGSSSLGWYADGNNQAMGGLLVGTDLPSGTSSISSLHDYSIYGSNDGSFSQVYADKGWFLVRSGNGLPPISAVPEPSILVLLGIGILSIGASRRRKFKIN